MTTIMNKIHINILQMKEKKTDYNNKTSSIEPTAHIWYAHFKLLKLSFFVEKEKTEETISKFFANFFVVPSMFWVLFV